MKAKFLSAALLVSLLVLSGCNGDKNPVTPPTVSSGMSSEIITSGNSENTDTSDGSGTSGNSETSNGSDDLSSFEVTFVNYDDTVLFVDTVEKGGTAVYEGETPSKPQDDLYKYVFKGWDKTLTNVKKSFTTKATFESIAIDGKDDYDAYADEWSEQGHLYIHYMRPGASLKEYETWAIWLWQYKPLNSEGTLWGASNPEVKKMFNEMSTSWMTNIGGSGKGADQAGVCMDIDLNKSGLVGGKTGKPVNLIDAKELGFLIMDQTSMDGGTHWTSDGGKNVYIKDFDKELAKKGYVHLYCVQGMVSDFTFEYSNEVKQNPVVTDKEGIYRSKEDLNSSNSNYGRSATSEAFKGLGVGYQIFVASFRDSNNDGLGDIRGIINSLDYLEKLGVEVLWLTPIQESESYHGYDITDFYEVDSKFGTADDYRELLFKAHKKGMKVLMDFVVNHTSKNNVWFNKSQRAEKGVDEFGNEINYRDMYHWKFKGDKVLLQKNGVYSEVNVEDHPDWYRDGESNYYYYGKFGSNMAELNYDCQSTRDLVISMAKYWLGFGVDGFRLDAVKHIYMKDEVSEERSKGDTIIKDIGQRTFYDEEKAEKVTVDYDYSSDLTKNVNFWKEFSNELKNVYPDCFLVGENFDGWGKRVAPYYQALDSQFDFALFYHNLEHLYGLSSHQAYTLSNKHAEETYDRYKAMNKTQLDGTNLTVDGGMRPDFINSPFTSNHDTPRLINHISGTAVKQGAGSLLTPNPKVTGKTIEINKAKVAAATTLLTPGISWIYYGDELGMSGNTDLHIEKYKYENNIDLWYRQPFKWGDNTETGYTFNSYTIEMDSYNKNTLKSAAEQSKSSTDNDMFDYYQALIKVKKTYGKNAEWVSVADQTDPSNLVHFKVVSDTNTLHVYVNAGVTNKTLNVKGNVICNLNGASSTGTLPPYSVIVTK